MYLLFGGYHYYPDGGWDDFLGSYNVFEDARRDSKNDIRRDWFHIVDQEKGEIVLRGCQNPSTGKWTET